MSKPRILIISVHNCIGNLKLGWTLLKMGYEVHVSGSHYSPTHSFNLFASVNRWEIYGPDGTVDPTQLANAIQMYSKHVDIIVYCNEPNFPFKIIKENASVPCVFSIHDYTSIRDNPDPLEVEMEKWALENADGFLVVSKGYLKKIREISKKPSALIYLKVTQHMFPEGRKVKDMPGLTYEGGVKGANDLAYNYPYRNWAAFSHAALKGMKKEDQIYFYTANDGEDFKEYNDDRIKLSPPITYDVLLHNLGRHTAGLVGSPYPLPDFKDSMPNKLFEYVAAGIPAIVLNAPEALEYVEYFGLGVGISDPSEVGEALEKLRDHRILTDRWQFTMEGEMPKLLNLFEEVLCNANPPKRYVRQLGV